MVGALAAVLVVAPAAAQGVAEEKLRDAGWTCFVPPPFPNMVVCGNPAHGLPPVPADPDGQASYNFLIFDRDDGEFRGTVHMIRAALYNGQPCPPLGGLYTFNPANGYYRCEHF
jgi:hypothetical protein